MTLVVAFSKFIHVAYIYLCIGYVYVGFRIEKWGRIKGRGQVNKSLKIQQKVAFSKILFWFLKTSRKMQLIDISCSEFFFSINRLRDIDQNIVINKAQCVRNLSSTESAVKTKD